LADIIGGLIGTFFVISVMSMLWKDNVVFRFGQAAIIGATVAHYCYMNTQYVQQNAVVPMLQGSWILVLPLVLGLLAYTRLSKDAAWLARYPTNLLVGVGTGLMIAGTLRGQIIDQVKQTLVDLFAKPGTNSTLAIFNAVLIFVGVATSLAFFIFTKEHKGALGYVVKVGRVFLMVSLGANFSGELVWYLTQMIGRIMYILNEFVWPLLGA
jgi:hypothetical protein